MSWYKTKRATIVTEIDGMLHCVYHRTSVVSWDSEKIILRSGGFETVTTKRRMNEVAEHYRLNYHVFQKDYEWFVSVPWKPSCEAEENLDLLSRVDLGDGAGAPPKCTILPFVDGMEILR